jgi:hypothetical protein
VTGKEGLGFIGKARAFNSEDEFVKAVESGSIKKGDKTVVILRYLGPQGGPGQSNPSSLVPDASRKKNYYFSTLAVRDSLFIGTLDSSSFFPSFPCYGIQLTLFFLEGMPEMLKPTSLIMGAGLGQDVACLTDGRFSGGCVTYLFLSYRFLILLSSIFFFFSSHSTEIKPTTVLTDFVLVMSSPRPKLADRSRWSKMATPLLLTLLKT